jgi:hypothetical protein
LESENNKKKERQPGNIGTLTKKEINYELSSGYPAQYGKSIKRRNKKVIVKF